MYQLEECENTENSNMSTGTKSFEDSSLPLHHCVVSLLSWQPSCPHGAACLSCCTWLLLCYGVCVHACVATGPCLHLPKDSHLVLLLLPSEKYNSPAKSTCRQDRFIEKRL